MPRVLVDQRDELDDGSGTEQQDGQRQRELLWVPEAYRVLIICDQDDVPALLHPKSHCNVPESSMRSGGVVQQRCCRHGMPCLQDGQQHCWGPSRQAGDPRDLRGMHVPADDASIGPGRAVPQVLHNHAAHGPSCQGDARHAASSAGGVVCTASSSCSHQRGGGSAGGHQEELGAAGSPHVVSRRHALSQRPGRRRGCRRCHDGASADDLH